MNFYFRYIVARNTTRSDMAGKGVCVSFRGTANVKITFLQINIYGVCSRVYYTPNRAIGYATHVTTGT